MTLDTAHAILHAVVTFWVVVLVVFALFPPKP